MYQYYTVILLLLISYSSNLKVHGQELKAIFPEINIQDHVLKYPFAGGINSAQYQELDIDQDGDFDLIIFDRSSDKVNCFENLGDHYAYNLHLEQLFPTGIQNWMILKDYDCDGKNDLFTSSNVGIAVYRNTTTEDGIAWELVTGLLLTESNDGSMTNLFLNSTDIPSIEDLDFDGDLDILVFDFANGINIEFHENRSNTGCNLDFKKTSDNYGGVNLLDCSFITFDENSSSRLLHLGGKALLSIDMNSDGIIDLALSEEDCNDISYMENQGSAEEPEFHNSSPLFPTFFGSVDFNFFPAAYHMDVTFDGNLDVLVSSNYRDNPQSNIDFSNTSFLYPNEGSNDFGSSQIFLQDEMVDVGSWAYPDIIDINSDGLNDIVIGNQGAFIDDRFSSSLTYIEATSDSTFEQVETDLFGLSQLHFTYLRPQFIHIDDDEIIDLAFTALNDRFSQKLYYLLGSLSGKNIEYNPTTITETSLDYNFGDGVYLYDMDGDDDLDALVGRTYGELDFFENTGNFEFALNTQNLLNSTGETESGNINITIADINDDTLDDLILTERSGKTKIYLDFGQNKSSFEENILINETTGNQNSTRFGRVSFPAVGLLSSQSLVVGSIQGGLRLFEFNQSSDEESLTLNTYPNPSLDGEMNFKANQDCSLNIYTTSGLLVMSKIVLKRNIVKILELNGLTSGMYLAKVQSGNKITTNKILILSTD